MYKPGHTKRAKRGGGYMFAYNIYIYIYTYMHICIYIYIYRYRSLYIDLVLRTPLRTFGGPGGPVKVQRGHEASWERLGGSQGGSGGVLRGPWKRSFSFCLKGECVNRLVKY